jgi:hypothetical protein
MAQDRRSSVKDLRGAWESKTPQTRASIGNALYSPPYASKLKKKVTINSASAEEKNATKSTRQTIEDLAVFASPRLVQKKLDIKSKTASLPIAPSKGDKQASKGPQVRTAVAAKFSKHEIVHGSDGKGTTTSVAARMGAFEQRKVTIRDRAKLFNASNKGEGGPPPMRVHGKRTSVLDKFYPPAPPGGATPRVHGKRTSVLDRFTPAAEKKTYETNKQLSVPAPPFKQKTPVNSTKPAKLDAVAISPPFVVKKQQQQSLLVPHPPTTSKKVTDAEPKPKKADIFGRNSLKPVTRPRPSQVTPPPSPTRHFVPETKPSPLPTPSEPAPSPLPVSPAAAAEPENKKSSKIDRKTIVMQEIDQIIREAEEKEIEDEMDEEVIEVLREAAVMSAAYTKRWYDVFTDSFIHCPSLATTLIDYSLLEIAEELYGEELPMLYTVSLRSIACEIADSEEEIPEYVFNMAV